jgi:hypothetical protein
MESKRPPLSPEVIARKIARFIELQDLCRELAFAGLK